MVDDVPFNCHEYVEWAEDDGVPFIESEGPQCAGAVAAQALDGGSTNLTRIEQRLGLRADDLTRGPAVWPLSVWPLVPEGATSDTWDEADASSAVDTCETVHAGCLAPAGYGSSSGVVYGTVAADGVCSECDAPLCSSCTDVEGRCGMCSDEDDEWSPDPRRSL